MEDPPMKEYQDYAPQEQQRNGYTSEKLHPSETIPMNPVNPYQEQQMQQPPAYQQPNSNPDSQGNSQYTGIFMGIFVTRTTVTF